MTKRLRVLAEHHGATLYMVLLAAFQVLLSRYSGQDQVIVGSPLAGRTRGEFADVVGYFVNPLPLRADLSANPSFTTFLSQVREVVFGALEHQNYPFPLLVERLRPTRDPSRPPIFQVMFVLQKAQSLDDSGLSPFVLGEAGARMDLQGLPLESVAVEQRIAQFDLTLAMVETTDGLSGSLEYNTDLFDAATVERMLGHLVMLLEGVAADPEQPVGRLPLLTAHERQQLLVDWNATTEVTDEEQTLMECFELQVRRTPEAVAVRAGQEEVRYEELNRRANQLAWYLRAQGVGPEQRVGLCVERGVATVVGLLGILKAGGAYVPLDPAYPAPRLRVMLEDASLKVLVTSEVGRGQLTGYQGPIVCLDRDEALLALQAEENPPVTTTAANLAYVIYTSGSTGPPKGVAVEQRQLLNRFRWMWRKYPFGPGEVCCQKTTLNFVDSIWELLGPLLQGIRVVVIPDHVVKDVRVLVGVLREERITRIWIVPALLNLLLTTCDDLQLQLPELRFWATSGEPLCPALHRKFRRALPGRTLLNLYGTSEVFDATAYDTTNGDMDLDSIPIGRPISNVRVYLLDRLLRPVPIGVPGEIHIGGFGLAREYLNRPQLTAERFIPDPYGSDSDDRLYKTGDLGRYRPDGNLEFLGRMDRQVKVRGFRVDLMEIETILMGYPGVREAVTMVREDQAGDARLIAYLVPVSGVRFSIRDIRNFLGDRLPAYSIPSNFLVLPGLPLNNNGKVDRRAFPPPDASRADFGEEYVAPRTHTENILAAIWADLLKLDRVGVRDNFFDLGGDSLLAMRMVSRLRDRFKIDLPLSDVLSLQSISRLASAVERAVVARANPSTLNRFLDELEEMEEEEAQSLRFSERDGKGPEL